MAIYTERLSLHQYTKDDFHYFAPLLMNEVVMRYITERALSLEETQERFQKAVVFNKEEADIGFYYVLRKTDNAFIGFAKLVPFGEEENKKEGEVGYALAEEHWGNKHATEITARLVELAQELKQFDRLIGIVDPKHEASIRVLTKNGLTWYEDGEIDGLPAAYYKLEL